MRVHSALSRVFTLTAGCTALAACVVGPNYAGPPTVAPEAVSGGHFRRATPDTSVDAPAARWWVAIDDAELDRLEDEALAASPDLEVARARLHRSRAGMQQQRANRLPNTGSSALYLRTEGVTSFVGGGLAAVSSAIRPGQTTEAERLTDTLDLYDVGFDATWELDLFGGQARAVEGAKAGAQASEADLRDAQVTLTAEVAQAYVRLRDLQQCQALSRQDAAIEAQLLALTQARRAGGTSSELDVERLNDQLETTRAGLEPLQAQITEQFDRLATLLGRPPGALDVDLTPSAAVPLPPVQVAVGDPAAVLRRRPDIRAAERRLQQQTALIGQRTADLFPKVTLIGNVGFGFSDLSSLLEGGGFSYAVAPILQWSPFDFGRTQARIDQARASRDEAMAEYRRTVLNALKDAETALSRYARQRENLTGLLRVKASADRAARLTAVRVLGGTATKLDALQAERRRVQTQTNVADGRAELTQDYVSLQKSLGLGWSSLRP